MTDSLRLISFKLLGQLVKVKGVITHLGEAYSQLKKIYYKCLHCGYLKGPFYPTEKTKIKLDVCYACQHNGPYCVANSRSVYRNFKKITVQECPSDVLPGRIPRGKEAVLVGDTIDSVKAGD